MLIAFYHTHLVYRDYMKIKWRAGIDLLRLLNRHNPSFILELILGNQLMNQSIKHDFIVAAVFYWEILA